MSKESVPTLIEALQAYKNDPTSSEKNICSQLDEFSRALAKDQTLRSDLPSAFPSLWTHISDIWDIILPTFSEMSVSYDLTLSLSRFMRNLVAGVPSNQDASFVNEPKLRLIVYRLTSFSQLEDSSLYPVTRMLVQTISNLVTLNDALTARLWMLYTSLPEEQNILTRLLASPDIRTVTATLVLIVNCVNTEDARLIRLTYPIGRRIVVLILDRSEEWVMQDEAESEENDAFVIGYRIFEALLKADLGARLYHSLTIENEPVTPHQTTLLKIIDSHLRDRDELPSTPRTPQDGYSFLAKTFLDLCSYAQRAIRRSLGVESPILSRSELREVSSTQNSQDDLKELDLRLPRVSAALILISQSLNIIYLKTEKVREDQTLVGNRVDYDDVISATVDEGFIECLVETLRLVDRFLPRIVFGKAAPLPGGNAPSTSPVDTTGFTYLKRDLVRLLGTICYGRRDIQDRVRECGGIQVVMNLCVIDERNPYMQEHALFALRNLLQHNIENQGIVDAMKATEA